MSGFWTNGSVLALAGNDDPEVAVVDRAQELALKAMSSGWSGPPFDPFELAELLGVRVVAREDLYDARTVPVGSEKVKIEYNPSRPRGRVRYSVAHELAHTLFPDVAEQARWRSNPEGDAGDAWQLEMLCNIAAGELLMPAGSFGELGHERLDIDHLMALRREYDVSSEALMMRVVKLTVAAAAMFAASRTDGNRLDAPVRLEYLRGSRAWSPVVRRGMRMPKDTSLRACTAVGYTAKADESWTGVGEVHVQGVGIPPYPGQTLPRIVGLLRPRAAVPRASGPELEYLSGDATAPGGHGPRVIAHVVNDKTPNWGGAFARALRDRYPIAQDAFREWASAERGRLALGNVHAVEVTPEITVVSMVAQRGYGPSTRPRLRYDALRRALAALAEHALARAASVHVPRLGAGQAGGRWDVISELLDTELLQRGIAVTVYSLPNAAWPREREHQTLLALDG